MNKKMTAKAERKLESGLVSEMQGVDREQELDPLSDMVLRSLDNAVARRMAGLGPLLIDPLTGLVLDSTPELVAERSGLEELDVQEMRRHRYDGQYPGEPRSHYLGGSNEITFGNCDGALSKSYDRVKKHAVASDKQQHWRNAYHQIGFIADRLNLPEPVREDVCRAYANLREQEISEAYSLERLLGLLTYVACRIHNYPRDFNDIEKMIDDLYGPSISRNDVTRKMVKAFNKGLIRFGIESKKDGKKYLYTWKRINGKRLEHRSLGRL